MRRRQAYANDPLPIPEQKPEFDLLETARGEYVLEFGEKPHHRMKFRTIMERLNDARNISA